MESTEQADGSVSNSTTNAVDSPDTTPALSLPPELILAIFERAVPEPPFLDDGEYKERLGTLLALALVHSSWTGAAQELLQEAIKIEGFRVPPSDLEKRVERVGTKTSKHAETKWLSIEGGFHRVIKITGVERWTGVRYLHVFNDSASGYPTLQFFATSFPRVETLKLSSDFTVKDFEPGLTFVHLRRLILGDLGGHFELWDDLSAYHAAFSPTSMPNLVHLSLAVVHQFGLRIPQDVFGLLLPQLTTLAWIDFDYDGLEDDAPPLPSRDTLQNLSHLSLKINHDSDLASTLVSGLRGGLNLKSLHLSYFGYHTSDLVLVISSLLAAIAKETKEEAQISRIFLHGLGKFRREVEQASELLGISMKNVEWREDDLPFEDFGR
ncbi:uncharacterized protein JCM6883_006874 [Sporobolomyces salmoneus]|uniref:uncharacterized protein n=1 Tax=Sporobolomyces salmoneus TaxID=183962 RepID=UPI00317733C4